MPTEDPQEHAHDDILPEIVVDESAEQYVQQPEEEDDQPPLPAPAEAEERVQNEVVIEPELPPAPEQDNIFQTGKPVKKKRNVSEKQRAHITHPRTKALERKKEKAAERKVANDCLGTEKRALNFAPELILGIHDSFTLRPVSKK